MEGARRFEARTEAIWRLHTAEYNGFWWSRQVSKSRIQITEEARRQRTGWKEVGSVATGSERWVVGGSMLVGTEAARWLNTGAEGARPLHTGAGRITK